jgi:hypothetical protein
MDDAALGLFLIIFFLGTGATACFIWLLIDAINDYFS